MKIKTPKTLKRTKSILCTTLLAFACGGMSVSAQPQSKTYIRYEGQARGYTELVTSYSQVRTRMISDIQKGHGAGWADWVSKGTKNNHSLYFWLRSEMYWQAGRKDEAYITAILALMFTKSEMNACGILNLSIKKMEHDILSSHKKIVEYNPKKTVIRYAILNAGEYLNSVVDQKIKPSGHSCYRANYLDDSYPEDMTDWSMDISVSSFEGSTEEIKERMGYYKILKTTTIDEDLKRNAMRKSFKNKSFK